MLTTNGHGILPLARRASRIVKGHPEGFPEGFANLYRDTAETIAAVLSSRESDPLTLHFPNSEDGLRGIEFIEATIRSSQKNGQWIVIPEQDV